MTTPHPHQLHLLQRISQRRIAPPAVMETRIEALRRAGTTAEFHRYPDVGHGFGPGIGTRAEGWIDRAIRFWEKATDWSVK